MFNISTTGWQTCLQSIAVAFHRIVNGFLRQGRPNQLKCICKTWELFLALIAAYNKTSAFPKPENPVDWGRMNRVPLIIGDEVTAIWLDETWNWKR